MGIGYDPDGPPNAQKWFWNTVMKMGDLSNEIAPAIGVRFERVVRTEEGKLNRSIKGYIQNSVRKIDCNFYIITTEDERKCLAFLTKWGVPYTKVIKADSLLEIADIVRAHDMIAYYDLDKEIVQNVNSRGSGKVDAKLWTLVEVS